MNMRNSNKLREIKTLYAKELEQKTHLEQLLRQCVDDVKAEINKKRSENKVLYYNNRAPGSRQRSRSQADDLTVQEREKIIEVLLSQERVLTLLYDKTFPPKITETAAKVMVKTKVTRKVEQTTSKLLEDLAETGFDIIHEERNDDLEAVSYTHLTLPTICSV